MGLPRPQIVSDILHLIADLVCEADRFLDESKLYQSSVKSLPLSSSEGVQPHKADRLSNRLRKSQERIEKPTRDVLRARRERKQRSRYQTKKLVVGAPRKTLGMRMRSR